MKDWFAFLETYPMSMQLASPASAAIMAAPANTRQDEIESSTCVPKKGFSVPSFPAFASVLNQGPARILTEILVLSISFQVHTHKIFKQNIFVRAKIPSFWEIC